MTHQCKRRRVLVVGASSGIGCATAAAFAEAGADVTAAARGGDKLAAVAHEIGAKPQALDMLDEAAVTAFFAAEAPFDHVVISAATTKTGSVAGLDLADAKAAMTSKFFGAYTVAKAARIAEGGSLTFVSGFLSTRPSASSVLQGAINAALEALAHGLALERAPVRVNAVSPGLIETPLWAGLPEEKRAAMFAGAAEKLPARRVGRPEDIAQAILFVASNPYVTGTTVTVDGGGTIG